LSRSGSPSDAEPLPRSTLSSSQALSTSANQLPRIWVCQCWARRRFRNASGLEWRPLLWEFPFSHVRVVAFTLI
jgi:hypothetical protein